MQIAAFLFAMLAFFALYVMTFNATARDLGNLAKWAEDFSDFPTAPSPPAGRFYEVRVLSGAFSTLMSRLATAASDLKRKNIDLEEQVREKTKDIFANHSLLQDILSELPQSVILLEKNLSVAYCNESAALLFGVEEGKRLPEALNIAFAGHFDEHERSEDVKFSLSGSEYSSVIKAVGEGPRNLIVVRDETRRLAIERQLLQAQKLESVSRLAGGVAHEFNNALASIFPSVEMLRTRIGDEKSLGYLTVIENSAQRGADVVKRILAFSRASEEVRTRLNLNEVAEGAVKLLRPAAKGVDVLWSPGEALPVILGDEKRLQQMILNLAINSLDALEGKGRIIIETWADPGRQNAYLSITDNGPGVPASFMENIFDPFFTTKDPGKGTGLGLAITFAVVEQHGGTIRHLRPTSGGARFEIKLPGLTESASPQRPASGRTEEIIIG
ncbi:hypothetical protein FDZ71_01035 [bacterium]|nr:MAG: hypothetical protein FDZ71_01035 [bacterium]